MKRDPQPRKRGIKPGTVFSRAHCHAISQGRLRYWAEVQRQRIEQKRLERA